jgi:hypothetical protein
VADTEKSGTANKLTTAVPQGFGGAGVITLHALTVTVCATGIDGGAVYNPPAVMVPRLGVVHVTPVLAAPSTVLKNCWVPPGERFTEEGDTITEIGTKLTWAVPQAFVTSRTLHALTVTFCAAATGLGAV